MSELSERDAPDRLWLLPNGNMTTCLFDDDPDAKAAIEYRPALTWTTETPTEPGWYWWQESAQAPEAVFVLHYDNQSGPLVFRDPVDRVWQFVQRQSGIQWAGPIPLPGEPE